MPLLLLVPLAACRTTDVSAERAAVEAVLDDFHRAAAEADGERYFGHMTPGAVFMGTDATERWSVEEFQGYAQPYFSQGRGWEYTSRERYVFVSPRGDVAWFDEDLWNEKYGQVRGTGVLQKHRGVWKVAHYNLCIPLPNELAARVVEMIRSGE